MNLAVRASSSLDGPFATRISIASLPIPQHYYKYIQKVTKIKNFLQKPLEIQLILLFFKKWIQNGKTDPHNEKVREKKNQLQTEVQL